MPGKSYANAVKRASGASSKATLKAKAKWTGNNIKNITHKRVPRKAPWKSLSKVSYKASAAHSVSSRSSRRLTMNNKSRIGGPLKELFYKDDPQGDKYIASQIDGFELSLKLAEAKIKHEIAKEKQIPRQSGQHHAHNPNGYFLIGEEMGYWDSPETSKIWDEVNAEFEIDRKQYDLQNPRKNFNVLFDTTKIKEYLVHRGLEQTYDPDNDAYIPHKHPGRPSGRFSTLPPKKNIKLLLHNANFRANTYYRTHAEIKNRLNSNSLACIKYKDLMYENLVLINNLNHNFLPFSLIFTKANIRDLNFDFLNEKTNEFYDTYRKEYGSNAVIPSSVGRPVYIARSVEYNEDYRQTGSYGYGTLVIRDEETLEKAHLLFGTFKTVMVSLFLDTKLVDLPVFVGRPEPIIAKTNYQIRSHFFASVIKNKSNNKYNLYVYLFKKGVIAPARNVPIVKTDIQNNINIDKKIQNKIIENPQNFDVHDLANVITFQPAEDNDINKNYLHYFAKITEMVKQLGHVLKTRIQIYPECIHAYDEFAIDLVCTPDNNIYLAEVNYNPGYNGSKEETIKAQYRKMLGYFNDSLQIYYKDYVDAYNNCMNDVIINGIVKPILDSDHLGSHDGEFYKCIQISSDLELEPGRQKSGSKIPIKSY